jgi:hypothetical protein
MITGAQIRAARELVKCSAQALSRASKLDFATVRRAQIVDGEPSITLANAAAIRSDLESAGVVFVEESGEVPGVRLRKGK